MITIEKFYSIYDYVIFTDGGVNRISYNQINGSSAFIVTKLDPDLNTVKIIFKCGNPVTFTTNNECEIRAISLAIDYIISNNLIDKRVAIISDSNISIKGLNEWYPSWVNNIQNNIMYSSSGTPVANQSYFNKIILDILKHNINVQLFHCKGHVNINSIISINKAKQTFELNGFECDVNFINLIAYLNDLVDKEANETKYVNTNIYENMISYLPVADKDKLATYFHIINNKEELK